MKESPICHDKHLIELKNHAELLHHAGERVMERRFSVRTKVFGAGFTGVLILALALAGALERQRLLVWYAVHGLRGADEKGREAWIEKIKNLGTGAVPSLLAALRDEDSTACANVRAALEELIRRYAADDVGLAELTDQLVETYPSLNSRGQQAVLDLVTGLVEQKARSKSPVVEEAVVCLLTESAAAQDSDLRAHALNLAFQILDHGQTPEVLEACRRLVAAGLADRSPEIRVEGVRLALHPGMDMLDKVVPLLDDPAPEVRRAAMLAVGPSPNTIDTENLLRWLHDSDQEVRRLCESALRGRGLHEEHVKLGRLMTDANPDARLKVLDLLQRAHDLDAGVWLRRLSHDSAPAVRAAAVRAAAMQSQADLSDRLEQMAQNDPCATVRQLAEYYLHSPENRWASRTRQ
jgi:HEAT repeat protein